MVRTSPSGQAAAGRRPQAVGAGARALHARRMAPAAGPCHGQASRHPTDVRRGRGRIRPGRAPRPPRPRAAAARPRPARSPDRPGSRSSPRSAAPSTGGASSRRTVAAGATAWTPAAIRASNASSLARKTPPARTTTGSRRVEVQAADDGAGHGRQLVGEPVEDRLGDRVALVRGREDGRRQAVQGGLREAPVLDGVGHVDRPAHRRRTRARSAPAAVLGPRPSRARTAAPSAARPSAPPPPQSPEIGPSAASLTCRPSGPIPAALTPAPQMTPTPSRARSRPGSAAIEVVDDERGRGQPARVEGGAEAADVRRRVGPGEGVRPDGRRRPLDRPDRARPRSRRRSACSTSRSAPGVHPDLLVRARRAASGRQQPAVRRRRGAMSVFELPPSTARTATSGGRAGLT